MENKSKKSLKVLLYLIPIILGIIYATKKEGLPVTVITAFTLFTIVLKFCGFTNQFPQAQNPH